MSLKCFFPEISIKDFKSNYWPSKPYSSISSNFMSKKLLTNTKLEYIHQDLRNLSLYYPQQVIELLDPQEEFAKPVTAENAYSSFLESNSTIRLRGIHRWEPEIFCLMKDLNLDLIDFPIKNTYVNLFISNAGTSGIPHFDGHEVFVLQLAGSKVWELAECHEMKYAHYGYVLGSNSSRIPNKLGCLDASTLPVEFPNEKLMLELREGNTLFMPRAFWHRTKTIGYSMHLTISVETYNWKDAFLNMLDSELSKYQQFREVITSTDSKDYESKYEHKNKEILETITISLKNSKFDFFAKCNYEASILSGSNVYSLSPFANLVLLETKEGEYMIEMYTNQDTFKLRVSENDYNLLIEVFRKQTQQFSIGDFDFDRSKTSRLFSYLVSKGIIWS